MTHTLAAMSEIVRVGGWSLRGLGYPFGVAERAVRFLAWAEAVQGQCVTSMRMAEREITESARKGAVRREREDRSSWRVEAGGKHLLEVGPPAVDLLTSEARRHEFGRVALRGASGNWLVPALVDLAARRGLTCLAFYGSSKHDVLPDSLARNGCVGAMSAPDKAPVFVVGSGRDGAEELLGFLRRSAPSLAEESEDLFRTAFDPNGPDASGAYVGLYATRQPASVGEDEVRACSAVEIVDFGGRLAERYRSGVLMDASDLRYLYELEMRTWAPTSERSRSQAGYGVY